jgi:hypothetical protein
MSIPAPNTSPDSDNLLGASVATPDGSEIFKNHAELLNSETDGVPLAGLTTWTPADRIQVGMVVYAFTCASDPASWTEAEWPAAFQICNLIPLTLERVFKVKGAVVPELVELDWAQFGAEAQGLLCANVLGAAKWKPSMWAKLSKFYEFVPAGSTAAASRQVRSAGEEDSDQVRAPATPLRCTR